MWRSDIQVWGLFAHEMREVRDWVLLDLFGKLCKVPALEWHWNKSLRRECHNLILHSLNGFSCGCNNQFEASLDTLVYRVFCWAFITRYNVSMVELCMARNFLLYLELLLTCSCCCHCGMFWFKPSIQIPPCAAYTVQVVLLWPSFERILDLRLEFLVVLIYHALDDNTQPYKISLYLCNKNAGKRLGKLPEYKNFFL